MLSTDRITYREEEDPNKNLVIAAQVTLNAAWKIHKDLKHDPDTKEEVKKQLRQLIWSGLYGDLQYLISELQEIARYNERYQYESPLARTLQRN